MHELSKVNVFSDIVWVFGWVVYYYKTCVSAGISNHEEYSLVREMTDDEKEKTLTLRRDKSIAKDQKKLEEMRKKLHTDDERTSVSVTHVTRG